MGNHTDQDQVNAVHAAHQNGHGQDGSNGIAAGNEVQHSSENGTDGEHDTGTGKDIFKEAFVEPAGKGMAGHAEDRQDHAG